MRQNHKWNHRANWINFSVSAWKYFVCGWPASSSWPSRRYQLSKTDFWEDRISKTGHQLELENMQKILKAKQQDSSQAAAPGLLFERSFIRPNGPHFGGSLVDGTKSSKHHLKRTTGNHVLTFEELTTLFSQVESILNSRAIGVISEHPKDCEILTPLICGTKLETFPSIGTPKKKYIAQCTVTVWWAHFQSVPLQFWKKYVTSL